MTNHTDQYPAADTRTEHFKQSFSEVQVPWVAGQYLRLLHCSLFLEDLLFLECVTVQQLQESECRVQLLLEHSGPSFESRTMFGFSKSLFCCLNTADESIQNLGCL